MASFLKVLVVLLVTSSDVAFSQDEASHSGKRPRVFRVKINFNNKTGEAARDGRNLASVFPFVGGKANGIPRARFFPDDQQLRANSRRNDFGEDPISLEAPESRFPRQRTNQPPRPARPSSSSPTITPDGELDIGTIALAGERCIDKVVMVEETEYDDVVECKHSYSQRCHTTYTTDFEPQQEEECDDNFNKKCFIEYKKVAADEKIQFCHTPLVCDGEGPVECRTEFETECQTKFHEHMVDDDVVDCKTIQEEKCESVTQGYTTEQKCTKWPKQVCKQEKQRVSKYSPETECKKVPREICGPSGCLLRPGPEECFDKKEVVIQEVPEETCNLEPQRICKQVTKLVPLLKAGEECVDIPKEVCSRSRTNPRKVQKPVVKKWCYVPTKESGLA